ncbi:MAG TPA: coenzyme F420-0:L-glutamate ligase [Marmoricola sp.]|nr:coenzyme F420-0:L-glutamate ligase [Marmoricola sp.]
MASDRLQVFAPDGIGEVEEGTDLADLVAPYVSDGDVVVVTSKVVSKAEGRVRVGDREQAIHDETVRVVARRGTTSIVETPIGVVMAAAGVDASNVVPGSVVLLPTDPDASARRIRTDLAARRGLNVAVVVSDTAGRAWRHGQTDLAIGLAGLHAVESFEGRVDGYGNPLAVTAPAVADEIAGIAEVATGKLGNRPVTVVRGLAERVLPRGEHGAGARVLVRETGTDMFGLGSREAVVAALSNRDQQAFGAPATAADLVRALTDCGLPASADEGRVVVSAEPDDLRVAILAFAHSWQVSGQSADLSTVLVPLS